jgi:hypothetical protein
MTTTIVTEITGQTGILPRIIRIRTDESFAALTADNFLKSSFAQGFTFYPTDIAAISYGDTYVPQFFRVNISGATITLTPISSEIVLPVTNGNVAVFDGGTGQMANGPVQGNQILTSAIVTPDVGANLITFNVTVGQAALATGGAVTLVDSSGAKQYRIKQLQLNSGGTNFSGGGGDRLGQVTDGTTVYSVIPAASLQTLANAQWGATALPNPASAAINTLTVAGTDLTFKYSGGATDYTAGSLVISGLVERVV